MSSVAQREVTLSPDGTAHIFLSTSKTDPRALGVTRSHKCACGSVPGAPCVMPTSLCPHCAVKEHLDLLASSGRAAPGAPFFPTQLGKPASKQGVARTIVSLMHRLGLPSHSASGAPLWGGHSMRIGGVQYLGRSGVEVARIQRLQDTRLTPCTGIYRVLTLRPSPTWPQRQASPEASLPFSASCNPFKPN